MPSTSSAPARMLICLRSRKPRQTTPRHDVPESVCHHASRPPDRGPAPPGHKWATTGRATHLLLTLPDQSRGLIPVAWTDSTAGDAPASPTPTSDALGSLADLLHARLI